MKPDRFFYAAAGAIFLVLIVASRGVSGWKFDGDRTCNRCGPRE